jgi:hypothetical protein
MSFLSDNESIVRLLHILSGMLYFFNLVNLPLLKFQLKKPYAPNMDEKATPHILIKTLFWFRWGAAFTVLFGLLLIESRRQTFGSMGEYFFEQGMNGYAILMGVLLALIMAFNVWFIIWPRQQKIMDNNKTIASSTDESQKKALAEANAPMVKEAVFASRMNTWLSIPMLWGMVLGAHGYDGGANTVNGWLVPIAVLLLVLVAMYAYSKTPAKKAA